MRKRTSGVLTILLASILALAACAPALSPTPAAPSPTVAASPAVVPASATPTPAAVKPASAPLTLEALKNAEYPFSYQAGKKVRLTDGKYEEAIQPGAASRITVSLHRLYALGDLNADGAEDAAVILVSSGGGSGTFFDLVGVINDGGAPRSAAIASLGDRIDVKSLAIKAGEISVEMTTQGPQDPLCCPTLQVTRTYKLQGDRLIQTGQTPAPAATIRAGGSP